MKNFFELVGFEYKKIIKRKSVILFSGIAILFAFLFGFFNMNGGGYYHKIGNEISSLEALKLDRETIRAEKGIVDDEMIKSVILQTQSVLDDENSYFVGKDGERHIKEDASMAYQLPYYSVYFFLNDLFEEKIGKDSEDNVVYFLTEKQAENFYQTYRVLINDHISNFTNMTEREKEKHIQMAEKISTPFYNDYNKGYTSYKNMFPPVGMMILTLIAIICAGLFAGEYSDKTAPILLSSKYGKSKAIWAKFFTGIGFSILISILLSALYLFSFLLFHGSSGVNTPIQFIEGFAYSTYPVTVWQSVLLTVFVTTFISVWFCAFCMFASAIGKSPFSAIIVIFFLLFTPLFFPNSEDRLIMQLMNLFPVRVFDYAAIYSEYFYTFGSFSLTPPVFYLIFSGVLLFLFLPVTYKVYQNHQVR